MILRKDLLFFGVIVLFGLAVSILAFTIRYGEPLLFSVRLLALNGYIALAIAAILTPFLKEVTVFFHKSFVTVHHYFAAVGLILITLHPIAVVILTLNPSILLPNLGSIYLFFFYGGSLALILIYLAFVGVLLRRRIMPYWRILHALMYVALFFGVIHANLWGEDIVESSVLKVVYDGLFTVALAAFGLKRLQFYRLKAKMKEIRNTKMKG